MSSQSTPDHLSSLAMARWLLGALIRTGRRIARSILRAEERVSVFQWVLYPVLPLAAVGVLTHLQPLFGGLAIVIALVFTFLQVLFLDHATLEHSVTAWRAERDRARSTAEAIRRRMEYIRRIEPLSGTENPKRQLELARHQLCTEQRNVIRILDQARRRGEWQPDLSWDDLDTSAAALFKWKMLAATMPHRYPGEISPLTELFDETRDISPESRVSIITIENANMVRDHALNLCELLIRDLEHPASGTPAGDYRPPVPD